MAFLGCDDGPNSYQSEIVPFTTTSAPQQGEPAELGTKTTWAEITMAFFL
jgi:hypothetical protein